MRKAVINEFFAFNVPFEGFCDFLYLDVKGLVTTGVGNLVDPMSSAINLPWRKGVGGPLATVAEIQAEWTAVKRRQDLAPKGGMIFRDITKLRLRKSDVETLVRRKLLENETLIRARFGQHGWNDWPANAQLVVHSMSWAAGANVFARFPKFCAHASRRDFDAMATECRVSPDIGTITKRNDMSERLLRSAAWMVREGLDIEQIYYGNPPPPDEAA